MPEVANCRVGNHRRDRVPETFGRGYKCISRWSVCSIDQDGHCYQIAAGVLAAGRLAFPRQNSAMRQSTKATSRARSRGRPHEAGVAEDGFLPSHLNLFLQAAAANDVTSTMRSASRWRISSSGRSPPSQRPDVSLQSTQRRSAIGCMSEAVGRPATESADPNEPMRNVDPLLFAAGECRRRQRPQRSGM